MSARKDKKKSGGSFVVVAQWERSEELRPDRLGPSEEDLDHIPEDQWRPKTTLR